MSRVYVRLKDRSITAAEFFFWIVLWVAIGVVVLMPATSTLIARLLGVGRGADAVIYISILVLFYVVFRLYVKMEFIEHELTDIVRKISFEQNKRESEGKDNHKGE